MCSACAARLKLPLSATVTKERMHCNWWKVAIIRLLRTIHSRSIGFYAQKNGLGKAHHGSGEEQHMHRIEKRIDVTQAAGLGETVEMAVTLTLPDAAALPERPVVIFACPGGGYSRHYFLMRFDGQESVPVQRVR